MISTESGRYAIRAMIHLAQSRSGPVPASEIADAECIPPHYLAKVLQDLSHQGLLESTRGRGGGFSLLHLPEEIRVIEILEAVENVRRFREECVLGLEACSDDLPCPLHRTWKGYRDRALDALHKLTLADLVQELEKKRRRHGA